MKVNDVHERSEVLGDGTKGQEMQANALGRSSSLQCASERL